MKEKIVVGMSGGVDSTVTLHLLKEQGYEPIGLYLDMKLSDDNFPVLVESCDEKDSADIFSAHQCAQKNGVSLYKFGCKSAFESIVISNFANEYLSGRTPNPCTLCNRRVKIANLLYAADMLGCEKVATGHYAKIGKTSSGKYYIIKGKDPTKDQSYMLWKLSQEQLSRLVFPLGNMTKKDIYNVAFDGEYISANRKESLDICFLPEGVSYAEFIEARFGKSPEGEFISPDGKVCGKHKGIIHYTVGQRKGLGVALGEPVFILKIDKEHNRIYLGRKSDEGADSFCASDVNFMKHEGTNGFCGEYDVKVRYAASPVKANVFYDGEKLIVQTSEKIRAITSGQSVVAYDGDDIVCGGIID